MSDRWFYRVFGQEFGPVSLDLVRTLVAAGTIAPDDEVRAATHSNWILACAASELRDSIKSPAVDLMVERRAVRDKWFCRGVTGDYGPLTLSDLIQLAALGELKPDEDVKATADDYWKQVRSIRRLVELLPFPEQNHSPSAVPGLSIFTEDDPLEQSHDCRQTGADPIYRQCPNVDSLPQTRVDPLAARDDSRGEGDKHVDRDCDEEVNILPFPGVQSTGLGTEPINSLTITSDLESLLAGLGGFEASLVLQNAGSADCTNDSMGLPGCAPLVPEESQARSLRHSDGSTTSHVDARENPLTLTLSPQGRGEGTGDSANSGSRTPNVGQTPASGGSQIQRVHDRGGQTPFGETDGLSGSAGASPSRMTPSTPEIPDSAETVAVASSHSNGTGSSSDFETANQGILFDEESFAALPTESDTSFTPNLSETVRARLRKRKPTSILKNQFSDLETIGVGVFLAVGLLMVVEWLAR